MRSISMAFKALARSYKNGRKGQGWAFPLVLAVAALLVTVPGAVPASASGGAVTTTIMPSSYGGRCLDDSFAYGLRVINCNGTNWQLWSVGNPGPGYAMQNLATGRCVDDSSAYGLRAVPCNGLSYQFFTSYLKASDVNKQKRSFQNVNTGACMDYSEAYGVRGFPCNDTQYQNWWVSNLL